MRRWFIIGFLLLACGAVCQPPLYEHRGVQYATHGMDFWFCLPRTLCGVSPNHACLYFMAEHDCRVTIQNDLLGFSLTKNIKSCHEINSRLDTLNIVEIPWQQICFADTLETGVPASQQVAANPQARGFHIVSTDTICVYLYAYSSGNIDVTNLLPTEMLRDEYVVQAYQNNMGMFQVVATEDNTVVDITLGDYDWLGRSKDSVVTVTLSRGMMYNVMVGNLCDHRPDCCMPPCNPPLSISNHHFDGDTVRLGFVYDSLSLDLSGTYIKARDNKRIAVFQGNQMGAVGGGGADLLFEQAMPIRYAGTEFLVPNLMASVHDYIQFTGLVDGTTITIMNPYDPTFPTRTLTVDARESDWFLINTVEKALYITSDHPILTSVMPSFNYPRYLRGGSATLVVVPVEWWHNGPANGGQTFWVDENRNAYAYYHSVHIFTRTDDIHGMYFNRYPIDTMFTPIPGTPYSYAYVHYFSHLVTMTRVQHIVENRGGGPFWVVADAEAAGEHSVYSYSHFQRGKNYLEVNGFSVDSLPEDTIWCMHEPVQLHGWVERPADSIIWDYGDGTVERYRYEEGQWVTHTYTDPGSYEIKRIIQYMDEARDSIWGYVACKSVYTWPSDTMCARVRVREHIDTALSLTACEGSLTFRGHLLEATDTHYITTSGYPAGCDTLWEIAFVSCPHCAAYSDTILYSMLPWVFNGDTFYQSTQHYPVHIDIGDECDSIIYYDLTVIPRGGGSQPDTVPPPSLDTIFVLAPNVVTPNGSIEANRTFRLFCSKDIEVADVYVFDRMGRQLAHFDGLTEEWDCTYDGKPLPQGAYVYRVRYIDGSNRNWKTKAGTFSIIR